MIVLDAVRQESHSVDQTKRTRGMRLGGSVLPLVAIVLVFSLIHRATRSEVIESNRNPAKQHQVERARMSDEISVHAAGRGNPYINLSDGHELITPYSGPAELTNVLKRNEARPLSLCSADFDEDGVPDLISGYAGPNGGIVTLLRGNVDSIYPNAPEAQRRRAEGTFTDAPFLSPAFVFAVPEAADFIGAGDFDGDGHWDVVTASRGSDKLNLMSGDGQGGLRQTKRIDLPGGVTAMIVGEINRRDGLDDVVVGVSGGRGSKVLVFEGPEGALRATPEEFELPAEPTSLALGQLDDRYEMDLAIAAGQELIIVHGRDRRLSLDARRQAEVKPAALKYRSFPREILSVAIGNLSGRNSSNDVALVLSDGTLHTLTPNKTKPDASVTSSSFADWREEASTAFSPASDMRLVSAQVSDAPCDLLIGLDSVSRRLQLIGRFDQANSFNTEIESRGLTSTSIDVESTPAAVLPMRLNGDALSDLVILNSRRSRISISSTQPQAAFVVINANDSGAGSLRQAIIDANNSAGADTISFNIPSAGTATLNLQSVLPVITGPLTIDGNTQPGFAGTPLIALRRTGQGATLQIIAGSSVIRGLDICTGFLSFNNPGFDVEFLTAGGNRLEGNIIGEAGIVVRSSNNIIGGTASSAGNKFAENQAAMNVLVTGQSAVGNQIQGNLFTARESRCVQFSGCGEGIHVTAGSNTTIGGTIPGARNVFFGHPGSVDMFVGAPGTVIQGNFIGVDSNGVTPSGNVTGIAAETRNLTIGGTSAAARNIISGHLGEGVSVMGDGVTDTFNLIQGNHIGTDVTGTIAVGNEQGVVLSLAKGTMVGGDTPLARNVISGNRGDGIQLVPEVGHLGCFFFGVPGPTPPNVDFPIIGNYIGTDVTGTQPLGNADGVDVAANAFSHEVRGNRIAFNARNGVVIPENSFPSSGFLPAFSIKILDNSIFTNGLLGIDLADDGVTQNDLRDLDSGANLRQNFPLLLSSNIPSATGEGDFATAATLSVIGTFNSTPNSTFTLQFFFGSGCDASGHQFTGAIPIPLGSLLVTTDASGNAPYTFSFDFPSGQNGGFVNSMATDAAGNTSEASDCLAVTIPLRITGACKGEGKQLIVNGSGFVEGAKVFLNGEQEKTSFVSSTQVIAKKAGKRAQTGNTLKVRNPDGSETTVLAYTRNNCPP